MAITEGPPILAAGMSLDGSLIALQRSPARLEFVSCKSQNIFVQVPAFILLWHFNMLISICGSGFLPPGRLARLASVSGTSRRPVVLLHPFET